MGGAQARSSRVEISVSPVPPSVTGYWTARIERMRVCVVLLRTAMGGYCISVSFSEAHFNSYDIDSSPQFTSFWDTGNLKWI